MLSSLTEVFKVCFHPYLTYERYQGELVIFYYYNFSPGCVEY